VWLWCDGKRTRSYPQGPLAAHLIGFANNEQVGLFWVEGFYDGWLRADGPGRPRSCRAG